MKIQRTDQESKQQKARLEAQLQEANEQLEDQVMNHVVDMRIEGLDKISEQLQENYDKYVKELQTNLDRITDTVNATSENLVGSIAETNLILESLLNSFHADLDFKDIGAEYFSTDNINTAKSNRYDSKIDDFAETLKYVTEQGTFVKIDNMSEALLPVIEDSLLEVFPVGLENIENTLNTMKNIGLAQPVGVTNSYDSLITINVEGNLDESVIPQIKGIASELLKNRDFLNGVYTSTIKKQTKDQRQAGM